MDQVVAEASSTASTFMLFTSTLIYSSVFE